MNYPQSLRNVAVIKLLSSTRLAGRTYEYIHTWKDTARVEDFTCLFWGVRFAVCKYVEP